MPRITTTLLVLCVTEVTLAATHRVPEDHKSIQAAINAAQPGDMILVAPGNYAERLRLKPRILLRSLGEDEKSGAAHKRAEETIIDGGGKEGKEPGVVMAEGSTLDGFTITNVGQYDEATWRKHFDSQGEELGDEEGSVQAEGTIPAVSIQGVSCTVINCLVHHNGDVGIGILGQENARTSPVVFGNIVLRNMGGGIGVAEGAEPIIQANTCKENLRAGIGCRKANPIITENLCYQNIRAGIGCREGARPIMRGNKCYQNRRAGIGIRMKGTAPVVENNDCYENDLAGIGCRDGAQPLIRNNRCSKNKMAGIGCDGSSPLIVGNECRENEMSGIGMRGEGHATIHANECRENKLVAIGVTDGSKATISGNHLVRTGGVPPIIAVRESSALVQDNEIEGGGVAAVLVQGTATVSKNKFVGQGAKQGHAVWVWEGSIATIDANAFHGYQTAVSASKATVIVTGNTVQGFSGPAIIIKDSVQPVHVFGNTAITKDEKAKVVDIQGPAGVVANNVVKSDDVGALAKPGFHATVGRMDTRIRFLTEGDASVFDITSATGIDKATIKRETDEWPQTILVRLHLGGLELFRAGGKETAIEWSVASTEKHEARSSLVDGKRVADLKTDSPYYSEVRIVGGVKQIPLQDGYFEIPLPAKLLEGNPVTISLEWIDFYRQ
jgi:parallel beta-helix repeat protein